MLNSVILMGRLTALPELKQTMTGVPATSFTLAVDRGYAKPGEEKQTDFIPVVAWRNTAEFICRYFTKGQLIAVSGKLQTRKWKDSQGNNRSTMEVAAQEVFFAESKREVGNSAAPNPSRQYQPSSAPAPAQSSEAEDVDQYALYPQKAPQTSAADAYYSDDDELPF